MTALEDRTEAPAPEVGKARKRKEDARLITGRTTWTDNMVLPGMLHLAVVRSPVAHAKITSVDVSAAADAPGVVAVFTGRDFAEEQGSIPCAWPVTPDMVNPGHPSLAVEEVNHVGEAVAVIVARSKAAAQDAVELVDVDYDPLPVVLDMEEAVAEQPDLCHDHLSSNESFRFVFDAGEAGTGQNTDEAFANAEVVVSRRFVQQRLIPAFMEPRAAVVQPQGDNYTMWSSTQVPHILRLMLAMITGTPEHKLRVIAPDVGGGFGGKLQVTPEEVITLLVARRLGKPVKWTETRSESLMSAHHGRDQIQYVDVAADREGNIKGLKVHILSDMGAYLRLVSPGVPVLGAFMYPGIYKFPAYRFDCQGVFTNKTPTDAYRGAGRPEATFAIERIMDELAVELGMDPLELRRKNWIKAEEFPFTTVAGLEYDSGDYDAATQQALELLGYDELREEQRRRRESDDPVQLGIGFSTFTEMCGLAPSRVLGSLSYGAGGWEHASIRMLPTGKVEVVTGSTPHGQGHETAWSQLVADELGVPFEDVEVLHGDTGISSRGLDTYGSRSLVVGGAAVVSASQKVVAKARKVAAHLLEAGEDDLQFESGSFSVRGTPGTSISIQEIALATFAAHNFPEGMEPSIDADATFDPVNFSFPHGTHICAMEVDTETGFVKIRKYACVDDVGKIVNPLIVEGQVHGGLAQGIAQALYEEAIYDADGNLTTGTFVDYLVPSAADLPHFDTGNTVHEAPGNPIGAKGVGEAGCIASTPAVVNAALDAVRHLGVTDIRMPLTPERVWRAIHSGGDGGDRATAGSNAYGGAQTETTAGVSTEASSLGGDR
ncbi:xanthine dehydrogenase family protein molybdopterin-binding subunit [Blastococcus sp. MG754426]|uniref:xanthine dehydrogenase family protein molybdopterin-binding subunit n=1 Tax=unclassified Blastococcus TaxID=2619396 RepID=UPI001EF00442|nr:MULTISPECIES: xanthine dehydrogenase family protein molybdopterin-binding subunit [unclassified Blastococcus]MCF6506732.1 xanthine dehydrogenase family protein molybdopterin-binding subunit [Blastococcus sp. MG754426]MCF6511303.1 xanthine dehydrogenase family protein molybdopterin-binding subunit [Blastococcus sp. MG754427]MCF6734757.1 xanthine dehydrogenase family protein molybdopterin-binding subunit [Blastococcus sp. KM273129]